MSRVLRILERAQADVENMFNWLVRRSVRGAISWYLAFRKAAYEIADDPEKFPEAPESVPLGRPLRQSFFKTRRGRNYRMVFEFSDTEIFVLRVRGPGQSLMRRRDLPSN